MDRDAALRAIDRTARAHRKQPSRGLWLAAAVVAVVAVVAFFVVMFADGDASSKQLPPATDRGYGGFTIGLVAGVAVGIAIGFLMGRSRHDHSSRSKP